MSVGTIHPEEAQELSRGSEQIPASSESISSAQTNTQTTVTITMNALHAKFQCLIEDPDNHRLEPHTDENGYTQMRKGNTFYSADNIYYPWGVLKGAEEKLDLYIAQCGYILPDAFFEYITNLISEYDSWTRNGEFDHQVTHADPHKNKRAAIVFSQIRAAQKNPTVLKDPRGMKIYEALANMKSENCFPLYSDGNFVDWNISNTYSKSGEYTAYKVNGTLPIAGIGPEHITSVLRIAKNGLIMNGTNQHFKKWWIKSLESLAASLIPAQARIVGQTEGIAPLDRIPPIEPKELAMYYEAVSGHETSYSTGSGSILNAPTSQLVFNSIHNIQTKDYREREKFSGFTQSTIYTSTSTVKSGSAYEELRQAFLKRCREEFDRTGTSVPMPWSDKWASYSGNWGIKQLGIALLEAFHKIKFTVSKNYFEVLSEIHDRVQGMIDECGTDICLGLVQILPEIKKVLEIGKNQKWDEEEGGYVDFDINIAKDLGKKYDEIMKGEKKRLNEIPAIKAYNDAVCKSKYDVFARLERANAEFYRPIR